MIEPRSVVHFSIAVSNLEASRKFYTEILGLAHVQTAPAIGLVFLRAGNDHVILAKSDGSLARSAEDTRRAHHAFKVDAEKYEDAKAFLASKGVSHCYLPLPKMISEHIGDAGRRGREQRRCYPTAALLVVKAHP